MKKPILTRVRLSRSIDHQVRYFLSGESNDDSYSISFDYKKYKEGTVHPPLSQMGYFEGEVPIELKAIFDGLWDMGIRPEGFEDMNRETEALRNHLADMRQLVYKDQDIIKEKKDKE